MSTHHSPANPRAPWTMRLRLTLVLLLITALGTVILVELGAAAIIYAGVLPARLPSFTFPHPQKPFVVDIEEHYGAWHLPGTQKVHRRACFDVRYRANSYGAIDIERPRRSTRSRTVVLGDSFTMGHGVDAEARFSNRLEQASSAPFLNFGVGGTGPLQHLMRYRYLAKGFDHDQVLLAILPDNDFTEDGPTDERYRPYWDGTWPDYTLKYSFASLDASPLSPSKGRAELTAHEVLGSFSFFYNAADWVVGARKAMHRRSSAPNYAGYFDYTDQELLRLKKTLAQFAQEVQPATLTILGLPRLIDLSRYESEKKNRFGSDMSEMARELGFRFVDLLPRMARDYAGRERELYLGCDGHFSPEGHRVAAETLLEEMPKRY